jgi:hypothetical protein
MCGSNGQFLFPNKTTLKLITILLLWGLRTLLKREMHAFLQYQGEENMNISAKLNSCYFSLSSQQKTVLEEKSSWNLNFFLVPFVYVVML